MSGLDEKDCKILNLLQKDCRISITNISKEIGRSVDSTKKRLEKLQEKMIFRAKVQIRPRSLGFSHIVDVKVRLHNYKKEDVDEFIRYLVSNPRVPEVFSTSGEWDLSLVIMAKNAEDLGNLTQEIRNKFGKIIQSWSDSLTITTHKFESYDIEKLMGFKK